MYQSAYYLCLFLALFLPLLLLHLLRRRGCSDGLRLPPGPWRLPVIGSLHHLAGSPLVHRVMADLARALDAPLMYLKLGEVPVVVATSPEAARAIMQTYDVVFATRPLSPTTKIVLGDGLVFARYGALWRQLRKMCIFELLSANRVKSFRNIREEEVGRLVATITESSSSSSSHSEPVNVSERISMLIAHLAMRAILGDRFDRTEEFLQAIDSLINLAGGFNLIDLFPSSRLASFISTMPRLAEEKKRKCFELIEYAIKQHKEGRGGSVDKPEEDLLDVLLRIHKEGGLEVPLTMGIIKAVIFDLFSAGSDSSANTLQWAMSELMRYPNVMEKAQAEVRDNLQGKLKVTEDDLANLKYLRLIIKETTSLHPVGPLLIPREAMEPCKILGYDVPKGTTVLVNAWAIGRNPEHWEDPEEFKPERFESGMIDFKGTNFEYLPFGSGRRMCPGIKSAEANMEIALAALLYHFDWKIPNNGKPNEVDMTEKLGIVVRQKYDLYFDADVHVPPV